MAPLPRTFITSVVDANVEGYIHIYYQSEDSSIVRELHYDPSKPSVVPPPIPTTVARLHSPLASIFTIRRDSGNPEARVYAQNGPSDITQIIPKPEISASIVGDAAVGTNFSATYDGNSVYIQYQKTGFEKEIFEKNVKKGTEKSVCRDVLPGTNISTIETSIRPQPPPPPPPAGAVTFGHGVHGSYGAHGVGICRYMVYTGTDNYLWFNWIDHETGPDETTPEIEQVKSLKPNKMTPNTPIAIVPVLEILAIYFLNESGQISRVDRGDYGWGMPKVVGPHSIKPLPGTNLAVANDPTSKNERQVWVSCQDKDGVITGFHDTVGGDS